MAWPPTIPPNNRDDTTPQAVNHSSDHNLTADALTETVDEVNDLRSRMSAAETDIIINSDAEAARNLDFVRGTSPRIQASGTDSAVEMRSDVIEKWSETGTYLGDVLSGTWARADATADKTLTGSASYIGGMEIDLGSSTGASSSRQGAFKVDWQVDMRCDTPGLVNVAVYTAPGGSWGESGVIPRGIWKTANADDRITMSGTGLWVLAGTNFLRARLYAWENSGAFTVLASNSNIVGTYFLK